MVKDNQEICEGLLSDCCESEVESDYHKDDGNIYYFCKKCGENCEIHINKKFTPKKEITHKQQAGDCGKCEILPVPLQPQAELGLPVAKAGLSEVNNQKLEGSAENNHGCRKEIKVFLGHNGDDVPMYEYMLCGDYGNLCPECKKKAENNHSPVKSEESAAKTGFEVASHTSLSSGDSNNQDEKIRNLLGMSKDVFYHQTIMLKAIQLARQAEKLNLLEIIKSLKRYDLIDHLMYGGESSFSSIEESENGGFVNLEELKQKLEIGV